MTDTVALMSKLREKDVKLWLEDNRLKCSAPANALDSETRRVLAERKAEIIVYLQQAKAISDPASTIVPIKRQGVRPPIFAVSGHGGDIFCLRSLARDLDPEQPVVGIQPPGLDGKEPLTNLEDLARFELQQIRNYQPNGPYFLAGHCAGGTLAFEIAHQLTAAGEEVGMVALIGAPFPTSFSAVAPPSRAQRIWTFLTTGTVKQRLQKIYRKLTTKTQTPQELAGLNPEQVAARQRTEKATMEAVTSYQPRLYPGRIDLFISGDWWHKAEQWAPFAEEAGMHYLGEREMDDIFLNGHTELLAKMITERLNVPKEAPALVS